MENRDDAGQTPLDLYVGFGLLSAAGYVALCVTFPRVWAAITAVLLLYGIGLFMTAFVFRFRRRLLIWGFAPIFGSAGFLFLWLISKLQSLLFP
jgi:hypothetical protein